MSYALKIAGFIGPECRSPEFDFNPGLADPRYMFGLGIPEILLILVVIVLIFGATRLPQIGEGLGKGIKNFRGALREPPEIDVTPDKNPDPSTPPNPPDPDGGSSSS